MRENKSLDSTESGISLARGASAGSDEQVRRPGVTGPAADSGSTRLIEATIAESDRRLKQDKLSLTAWRVALIAGFLVAWELLSGRLVDSMFISKPSAIGSQMIKGFAEQDLLNHAQVTAQEAIAGFLLGATVGVVLALIVISIPRAPEIIEPIVLAIYGIPKVALAPLFIVWFGLGMTSKIAISGFMVFFIVFMSTLSGLSRTSPGLLQVTRMLGASRLQLLWRVRLPAAVPEIMTALKITVPLSMIGAVVGEFVSSQEGLGFYVNRATMGFNTANAFAGVFLLMTIVLLMSSVLALIDRWLLPWRREQRTVVY